MIEIFNIEAMNYTNISKLPLDLIDDTYFIGKTVIQKKSTICRGKVINEASQLIFGSVMAAQHYPYGLKTIWIICSS